MYRLLDRFEDARNYMLGALTAYVREHGNVVSLSGKEHKRLAECERYYASRYHYKELKYDPLNGCMLTYEYNPAQEDSEEPDGGWLTFKDEIGNFSCDELYDIIKDIKE